MNKDGLVETIAEFGKEGYINGDENIENFYYVEGICLDKNGDIIVADTNKRI
jgi:hypothetical protein